MNTLVDRMLIAMDRHSSKLERAADIAAFVLVPALLIGVGLIYAVSRGWL